MTELHSLSPQSIIHRDLKAANVLLSANDQASAVAKVTDFGVAMTLETVRSSSSAGGGGAGTLQWMAPETFENKYSQKTDVYSFAVLAFEMATNKVPYEGLSVPAINKRAMSCFEYDEEQFQEDGVDEEKQRARWNKKIPLHTRRPDLGQVQSVCPRFLECLIEKCWSDKPDERPEFTQIADSLRKLQEGRPYWGDGGNDVRLVLADGAAFQKTLGPVRTQVTVAEVERVQHPKLWAPFAGMRQTMLVTMLERSGCSSSDSYERTWLFHGTAEDSVDQIVADGFNRNFGFSKQKGHDHAR